MTRKSNNIVSLNKYKKDSSGVVQAIQSAAQDYASGKTEATRIIIVMDDTEGGGISIIASGINKWDGAAMLEMAKFAILSNDEKD